MTFVYATADIFYVFDSRYKKNFNRYTVKIGQLGFMYPMIKITALNRYFSFAPPPLIFINRLSALVANFERTINYLLGHANSRKIVMFITAIRHSDNNAYPC